LKAKEVNIVNYLNQIFYKTDKYEYDKKLAPAYMLSMWLSHDSKLIDVVNKLNSLQFSLRDDIIYKYYMSKVPKGKRFIKWAKRDEKDKKRDKVVLALMEENWQLSKREATQIAKFKENIKNDK
jgi:hypothetical protein